MPLTLSSSGVSGRLALLIAAALCAPACSATAGTAQPPGTFEGKTIRLVVAFSAGGVYDLHARVMADFLGRHLPGTPTVLIENMPGAGGLVASGYLARQVRPDGLTLGMLSPATVVQQLIGHPRPEYDAREFIPIGSPSVGAHDICAARRDRGIDLSVWRSHGVRVATTGRGSASHVRAAFLTSALGLPVRLVSGYRGSADVRLALESGEADVLCQGLEGYKTFLEPSGGYVVILQSGEDPALIRQGIPSASLLVQDDRGRTLLKLLSAIGALDRFYVAPPHTPDDVVTLLRTAFEQTMADAAFLAAAQQARLEIRPVSAGDITTQMAALLDLPDIERRMIVQLLSGQDSP
jgi:tripartite-type tricarboxylate transporter receptor subunit TctC